MRPSLLSSVIVSVVAIGLGALGASPVLAGGPNAQVFGFVGTVDNCGVEGARIVTAAWLGGLGLPDDATTLNGDPAANDDRRFGLLLNKNGATPVCSASGAIAKHVGPIPVTAGTELGFDYRNGSHCSGGSPRFNVSWTDASTPDGFSFVGGCGNDTAPVAAPQDAEWTRVRFSVTNPSESFPVIPAGATITSVVLIFDEGTDTPSTSGPAGIGLAVVDNILVGGTMITRGSGNADPK